METHQQPIRVLVRPPVAPVPAANHPPQPPPPPAYRNLPPKNGVVVVGFIGKRHHDVDHLINKIIDSRVFGSGNLDTPFRFEPDKINPEMSKWFESRKLSFYHDEDQCILYLQFSSLSCPTTGEGFPETRAGFESFSDELELGDLQGLIFMFSVCHILILIQDGSRFDTQILKKFRVLQAAKHTLAPIVKSQNKPPSTSNAHSSFHSRVSIASTKNPSSGKSRGFLNRNVSHTTPLTGLGSYTSLLPGQCTPVLLFVFLDNFTETHPDGIRKKLQSSLEAQIRFSIKKCRTLSILESGSRIGAGFSSPLFSLDASKAVSLVDSRSCRSGESLEFALGLVRKVLDGKATPDSLLLESHQENAKKDEILPVKEFIYKQSDIIKGKGGLVSPGGNLFAAAAASSFAVSKKTSTAPELPTFEIWSSSSRLILHGILSVKGENDSTSSSVYESGVSILESAVGLNGKFSNAWCGKALPVAKEVYLDNLPPCYPSRQHEEHIAKALRAFTSMAKGPAVKVYTKNLKDECTSIWTSGRRLCDAISLTGKPCAHKKHDDIETHSSGFAYLHACACGRTRRMRPDPFDYDEANDVHNTFADCDKLLPGVKLPEGSDVGPVRASSWKLVRIGSARYYDPSKGLLQSGFCSDRTFLLRWTLFIENLREANGSREISFDKNVGVENGLPNFTMRKPFSEVVAGPAGASSSFPPLFSKKQHTQDTEIQESRTVEGFSSIDKELDDGDQFPHISSVAIPSNTKYSEQKAANFTKRVDVFVGFEYECPYGHRFILTHDHLGELDSAHSVSEENNIVPSSVEILDRKQDPGKSGRLGGYGRNRRQPVGVITGGGSGKTKNVERLRDKMANGNKNSVKFTKSTRQGAESADCKYKSTTVNDGGGCAFSLLDRNLPIYMNCPDCGDSTAKNDASEFKFASTISQLQRIFVVTPSFPVLLAADPVIQFELSCLPPSTPDRERKLKFGLGCPVILPADSLLSLRLPFIYGTELEDGSVYSLKHFEHQPQMTASVVKGTTLRVVSNQSNADSA